MRELLEDQVEALGKLRDAVRGGSRRIIMQAPTGWGKTMLASALVSSAREKNKHALFTVPMISLIDQTIENFAAQGIIDVGVIQAMHQMTDWGQPVQVASIQTLQKRTRPKADVVMADEIHRWFKYYEKWFRDPEWQNIPIIGLSASPWTRGLGAYFDTLIVASTIEQLIERGRLSPFRVFAPTHPDLKNVRTSGGDYNEGELGHAMNTSDLVADALQTWLKHAEGRPTLCFAVNRAHAKHLQQQFATAGVPCAYQDAYTKADERRLIRLRFHNGDIKVVFNVGTLTTGVDWDVRCISLCRPTKSHTLMVQMIGRGLRTAPGKVDCLILDHSDNHLRLGFVTDIEEMHQGLHNGKTPNANEKVDAIRLPKECPQCHYLKAPKMAVCPSCGFIAQQKVQVEVLPGELKELQRKKKKKRPNINGEKPEVYGQLLWWARDRGYKPGWVANKYKEIFEVWPTGMSYVKPIQPTAEVMKFIQNQNANYGIRKRYLEKKSGTDRYAMTDRDREFIDNVRKEHI